VQRHDLLSLKDVAVGVFLAMPRDAGVKAAGGEA